MKAVLKKKPEPGIDVSEVLEPNPDRDEVLVRVKNAAICGSDMGLYRFGPAYKFVRLPVIMGHEFAGDVVQMGEGVDGVEVGERVVAEAIVWCGRCYLCRIGRTNICEYRESLGLHRDGCFAEYIKIPVRLVHKIPDQLSYEEATFVEPFSNTIHGMSDICRLKPGDFVHVYGPGPMGLLYALTARLMGASYISISGIDADRKRLDVAEHYGFHTINSEAEDLPHRIQQLTHGKGVDIVVITAGAPQLLAQSIELVKNGGQILVVAIFQDPSEVFITKAVRKEVAINCVLGYTWRNFEQAITLLAGGEIDVRPMITHKFLLDDATEGFETVDSKKGLKVLFENP